MAKKKSNVSGIKLFWQVLTIALGGLLLGFLALPHISVQLLGSELSSTNGYSLIDFSDGADTGVAIVLLLLVIFLCLMVLGAIIQMLCGLGVFQSESVAKFAKFVMTISALAVAVLAIVNIITVASSCNAEEGLVSGELTGTVAVWATLIINAVIGVCAFVSSLFSAKK